MAISVGGERRGWVRVRRARRREDGVAPIRVRGVLADGCAGGVRVVGRPAWPRSTSGASVPDGCARGVRVVGRPAWPPSASGASVGGWVRARRAGRREAGLATIHVRSVRRGRVRRRRAGRREAGLATIHVWSVRRGRVRARRAGRREAGLATIRVGGVVAACGGRPPAVVARFRLWGGCEGGCRRCSRRRRVVRGRRRAGRVLLRFRQAKAAEHTSGLGRRVGAPARVRRRCSRGAR